jgi:hypothetical protein
MQARERLLLAQHQRAGGRDDALRAADAAVERGRGEQLGGDLPSDAVQHLDAPGQRRRAVDQQVLQRRLDAAEVRRQVVGADEQLADALDAQSADVPGVHRLAGLAVEHERVDAGLQVQREVAGHVLREAGQRHRCVRLPWRINVVRSHACCRSSTATSIRMSRAAEPAMPCRNDVPQAARASRHDPARALRAWEHQSRATIVSQARRGRERRRQGRSERLQPDFFSGSQRFFSFCAFSISCVVECDFLSPTNTAFTSRSLIVSFSGSVFSE